MTRSLDQLARQRRAVRNFRPDSVPAGVLDTLLETVCWAPSGYNLQPTHFLVAQDESVRRALQPACLGQRQVAEAPAVVVFAGDRHVAPAHLEPTVQADLDSGAIDENYAAFRRASVRLAFGTGPLGFGWVWKALLAPVARTLRPVPEIPAVHRRAWLSRQVMLSAMVFMLAAADEGLATCPMEGFDENRLRRALGIPRRFTVPIIVAVGYEADATRPKSRLPLAPRLHHDRW